MAKKSSNNQSARLFEEAIVPAKPGSGQLFDVSYGDKPKPVECLGMKFPNDDARRAHFTEILRKKLKDPAFRSIEGFPIGEDEDILAMSDPPYYTACPNPFIKDFLSKSAYRKTAEQEYHREPFAADVSEGKTDGLYTAHGYHTKVPHKAIVRYALHYTEPGDVILDGFSGSGMTGVAAQMCGCPDSEFRQEVETERRAAAYPIPQWGERRVILSDLSPVAAFISANYNIPVDVPAFREIGTAILSSLWDQIGSMYETTHPKSSTKARINFTLWSEVFRCQHCGSEVVFLEEGFDEESKKVKDDFPCPKCSATLTKRSMERIVETRFDPALKKAVPSTKRKPILINYSVGAVRHEKKLDAADLAILDGLQSELPENWFPSDRMMHASENAERWGDKWRAGTANFTHTHHLYMPRPLQALSHLWSLAEDVPTARNRLFAKFFVEQAIWGLSILNRYGPTHYSQVNRCMSGSYYMPAQFSECSPWYNLEGKLTRLVRDFARCRWSGKAACISTGSCTQLPIPDESVDYIFTDPPFGDNLAYAELNFLIEAWHQVFTNMKSEAIMSDTQKKTLTEYQDLMRRSFKEYHRVLKPGRWMTVVFHNSQNAVWNAIQEAVRSAGFVIADVRTLDKKQGSFNQVLASGAVKQDLTITAYKPTRELEETVQTESGEKGVWSFVETHLSQLPIFLQSRGHAVVVAERQEFLLFDRMVAFYVQRGLPVPLSASDFYAGLHQRFSERDGMYFLSEQAPEYDRKRLEVKDVEQYQLFVSDEKTAIQWVRRQLHAKPMKYSDLQPLYMQEAQRVWGKHEQPIELLTILEQNFIEEKSQWRVPDPKKESDLEQLRHRALMKEFQQYIEAKGKLRVVRTEALRAGFKEAWQKKDYTTIVEMAKRIPDAVIQEDQALLMYFDNASLLKGE
jgi:16S rRNA G966 N2-methylase RsmD